MTPRLFSLQLPITQRGSNLKVKMLQLTPLSPSLNQKSNNGMRILNVVVDIFDRLQVKSCDRLWSSVHTAGRKETQSTS